MNEFEPTHNPEDEDFVSKTELKRQAQELQDFANELLNLPGKIFDTLPFTDELREALLLGRRLDNSNARKRHLRYLAKLLQKTGTDEIRQALQKQHQQSQQLHSRKAEVEHWCTQLLEGDDNFINQLVEQHPNIDRTHLRQLIRQANKDAKKAGKAPSNQKLFPYLLKQVLG